MKTLVMCELPGPCNFNCEYCYVPDEVKATQIKEVTALDWIDLASKFDDPFFWFCGAGEPTLRQDIYGSAARLSARYKVGLVTNLATDIAEELLSMTDSNIGFYTSIHWHQWEAKGIKSRMMSRYIKHTDATIWPTIVIHPSYFEILDDVLELMESCGRKLIPTRYRVDQGPLANIDYTEIEKRLRDSEHTDMRLWDATPDCWDVKGGICSAGVNQVIVDYQYNICTCHGNGNKKVCGKFPEDIDKVKPEATGICYSDKCPCKHSVMWGVNSKFDYTFGSILAGWDSYVG